MPILDADQTRKAVLHTLLVQGEQPIRLILDPKRLGDDSGFPAGVLGSFPDGVPIDLDPNWPLQLDFDETPGALTVSLSFRGAVSRCCIPYRAIRALHVGLGSGFRHEPAEAPAKPRLRLV